MTSREDPPRQSLGALPALALVAGSMLGIGIFISPHEVAAHVNGDWTFLAMWLAGGIAALFGALSLAELGAMLPRSGGDYSYLRLGWGKGVAFAAGWLQLLAIFPGSLASVAVATSTYQLPVLLGDWVSEPISIFGVFEVSGPHVWAVALIVLLTAINHIGVRVSGVVQVLVTSVPLAVLLLTSLVVSFNPECATNVTPRESFTGNAGSSGMLALALAYLPVYFAYSGWNAAIYVGGEIKNPGRNLPRALVGGTLLVTALYMTLCIGYLQLFGLEGLADVGEAGTASAKALFGPVGVVLVTGLILLAMMGTLNGTVLTGSRIAHAMAQKGDCFEAAGSLHPRFQTPTVALWLQAAIAMALLFTGSHLDQLISYTSSAMLITGTLTVLTVVVLRRRMGSLERPYRTWLYPLPPLAYAGSSLLVLVMVAVQGDPSVWVAAMWFAGALAFYALRKRRSR